MSAGGDDLEEVRRLRRRVADLEAEAEITRRLAAFDGWPGWTGADLSLHRWRVGALLGGQICARSVGWPVPRTMTGWAANGLARARRWSKRRSSPTGSSTSGAAPVAATVCRG